MQNALPFRALMFLLAGGAIASASCSSSPSALPPGTGGSGTGGADLPDSGGSGGGGQDADPPAEVPPDSICALGMPIKGASLPTGFCARVFAKIDEPRTLTLAPNGDIFVGAPSESTPGGASGGPGAIVVLSDDDHDGVAEQATFLNGVGEVHGLAIGGGYLYFTLAADVWRTPYASGQRKETGPREALHLPQTFGGGGRWTHGLARSVGGQLLASRGEYGGCGTSMGGEISRVDMGTMTPLARAFRNPMYLRCHPTDEVCAAAELGEDLAIGAVEKFLLIKPNTNYGYPCCFEQNKPANGAATNTCVDITAEDATFVLSETPFGFDWERGLWPEPHKNGIFVALHGSAYSSPPWKGARVVFAPSNSTTHAPVGDWRDFMEGFALDNGGSPLKRPSDIVFSPDGRMFVADDQGGQVYWIAPASLSAPR